MPDKITKQVIMISFEVRSKLQTVGSKAGQTVYYAWPKDVMHLDTEVVIARISEATSLTNGDVKNALISLRTVVSEALSMGMSVDLAEMGRLRVMVPSRMVDSAEEVDASILKVPKIIFTPKADMLAAAKSVTLSVDTSYVKDVTTMQVTSGSGDSGSSGSSSPEEEGAG